MKNIKKYIILAIFLSFAFMSGVSAASYNTKEVSVAYERETIFDLSQYQGLSCDTGSKTFTEFYSLGSGSYGVKWKDGAPNKNGTERYSCTFTGIVGHVGTIDNKNLTIKVNYGKKSTSSIATIQLVKDKYESRNLVKDQYAGNISYFTNLKKIKSVSQYKGGRYASGANYAVMNCAPGGNACSVSITGNVPNDSSKRWASFTVYYTMTNGEDATVIFDVEITSHTMVFAYPGTYGVCNFNGSWEKESASVYKQKVNASTIKLPSCDASKSANPLIEFVGWSNYSQYDESGHDYQALNKCVPYANVAPGDYVANPDKTIYTACYKSTSGIILVPNGATITSQSNYTFKDSVIYVKQSGSVVLPEPTEIPALYNMYGNGRFEGWIDTAGKIHAAGTSVPADGERYMATFSTGQTVDGESVNQKMVYVGEVVPYSLNSTTIKSCTSADTEKLSAYMSGGQCFLKGIKDSGSSYIDVAITTQSSTRTLKVRVVSRDGQYGDDWDSVIIDDDNNSNADAQDGYFENIAGANVCNTYAVSNAGSLVSAAASYKGFNLSISKYNAKSKCNDNKNYLALCMDPGRPGPQSSDVYEIDKSFTTANEFGKLVSHIVQKFVNENETNSSIAAANIALRIIEYYSIEELASSNNGGNWYLSSALSSYQVVGQDLKDACESLRNCDETKVYNALGKHWTWNSDDIRRQVAKFLTGYTGTVVDEDRDIKNETKRTSSFSPTDPFSYTITYEGKLTFPDGMGVDADDISYSCGSMAGVSGCSLTGEFTSATVYKYKFVYNINLRNRGFSIPKSDSNVNPHIKVNATSGVTSANVFVIKTINDNKQRMVIFNTEPVNLTVLMPIYVVCDIEKDPFKIGAAGFREDLFKTAGCCEFITDETSNEFLTYCTADCINTNFATMCNPNATVGNNATSDVYSINESYRAGAGGTKELNYACIVDVKKNSSAINNTNNKIDDVGNYYALMAYHGNQYCSVSCKEDWDISTASFANFVGGNAIAAGQTFSIETPMFIGGSRTCVTTYVDYSKYQTELRTLSKELVAAWNKQSQYSKVYSELKASKTTESKTYYTYTRGPGYDCDCVPCGTEENPQTCCDTCYDWTQHVNSCDVSKITLYSSKTYDQASWSDYSGYATSGSGSTVASKLSHPKAGSATTYGGVRGVVEVSTTWNSKTLETEYFIGDSNAPGRKTSSSYWYDGKCNTAHTIDYLFDNATYDGSDIDTTITNNRSTVNTKRNAIYNKAVDMTSCQNFMLKNTSTERKNSFNYDSRSNTAKTYNGKSTITGFLGSTAMPLIDTKFEPSGSYDYEEREFMSLVGKDNVIETHDALNQTYLQKKGKDAATFNNDYIVIDDRKKSNGENIKLYKNYLTTKVYSSAGGWSEYSAEGKTYGGSGGRDLNRGSDLRSFKITLCNFDDNDPAYENRGKCDFANGLVYYYPFNYTKQTLSNSSFYRNKGSWFINNITDTKQHADNFAAGVTKLNAAEENVSLLGNADNTFPISVTTPRNIYQYSYTFSDIGYFSDGTTGRIMGNAATSLIAVNKHACFYEVIEDICRCCGDPMLWTTYSSSNTMDTGQYLNNQNYDYVMSLNTFAPGTTFSSQLGYSNSSVSLYDLDGTSGGTLVGNWGSTDKFTYQSNVYTTGKGASLAQAIVNKGETVYNTKDYSPEYSYTLNPTAISSIRDYNGSHKYGYSTQDLIAYGISKKKTPLDGTITDLTGKENEVNTFGHYGSKFLEDFMTPFITTEFRDSVLTNRQDQGSRTVCSVSESDPNAAQTAYSMIQSQKCRWVDYIETNDDGTKVRLAFK